MKPLLAETFFLFYYYYSLYQRNLKLRLRNNHLPIHYYGGFNNDKFNLLKWFSNSIKKNNNNKRNVTIRRLEEAKFEIFFANNELIEVIIITLYGIILYFNSMYEVPPELF